MINYKNKAEGMTVLKNGTEYKVKHEIFIVKDITDYSENQLKIHIANKNYDTVILPFIDTKITLSAGDLIKVAFIDEGERIICHGYEKYEDEELQKELSNLDTKQLYLNTQEIDIDKYMSILNKYINAIQSESIRNLVNDILDIVGRDKFTTWPAASSVHHNVPSGLLLHTVNVTKNAFNISVNYTDIDKDLVLAGAILHDVCKVYEYNQDGTISSQGMFRDHISMAASLIQTQCYSGYNDRYPELQEKDVNHLIHIILSHHGKLEWGSPKEPATKEAFIVHMADYIDTNMYIFHQALMNLEIGKSFKSKYKQGNIVQTKLETSQEYDLNS